MNYEGQLQILQNNLYKLMQASNTSMRQLSTEAGMSPSYVQKLLSGDINPRLDKLVELGNYFDTSSSKLLDGEEPPSLLRQEIHNYLLSFDDSTLEVLLEVCKRMGNEEHT